MGWIPVVIDDSVRYCKIFVSRCKLLRESHDEAALREVAEGLLECRMPDFGR